MYGGAVVKASEWRARGPGVSVKNAPPLVKNAPPPGIYYLVIDAPPLVKYAPPSPVTQNKTRLLHQSFITVSLYISIAVKTKYVHHCDILKPNGNVCTCLKCTNSYYISVTGKSKTFYSFSYINHCDALKTKCKCMYISNIHNFILHICYC